MSNLTAAQKARIKHHLGYTKTRPFSDAWLDGVYLFTGTIDPQDEIVLVGNFNIPPVTNDPDGYNDFYYQGERIATPHSILWNVEVAKQTMNPINVDASLFVSTAGSVKLRANELSNRENMYDHHLAYLAQFFEVRRNHPQAWASEYR